jgi:mannose-6-phosphate isomerase-like protein (cupin superfamily)
MRTALALCVLVPILGAMTLVTSWAGDHVRPSCDRCLATHVTAEEVQEFLEHDAVDQQVRSVDVGKANVQIAVVHRGPLASPGAVAEHSLVTEVYYVMSGSGSHRTGPDLVDSQPRPAENYNVTLLNGPGHSATDIRNAQNQELKAGDVLVIPAGTGHQFTRIDDHITYLMVRVDPDKVVPLMTAEDARAYLAGSGRWAR